MLQNKRSLPLSEDKLQKGFYQIIVLFTLLVGIGIGVYLVEHPTLFQPKAKEIVSTTPSTKLLAGFNEGGSTCKLNIGPQGYQEITMSGINNFSNTGSPTNIYTNCKEQFLKDIDELGKDQFKIVRIWPELSQFAYDTKTNTYGHLNSNINNFDEILSAYARNNIKVYLTLNQVPVCATYTTSILNQIFNPNLINNPTLQTAYIASLQEFLVRYKDNPAVGGYDLVNEVAFLVLGKGQLCNYQGSPIAPIVYDSPDLTKTKTFLTRMFQTAKSADPNHKFTFSFGNPYDNANQTAYRDFFKDIVDFYDIHAYSYISGTSSDPQPETFYDQLPKYDKPLIHGEVGIADNPNVKDSLGNSCFGNPNDPNSWGWVWMNDDCQNLFLDNGQRWVKSARLHNINKLFFHSWPPSRRYGARIYQPSTLNTVSGYTWTKAGAQFIHSICPNCKLNTNPPN